MKAGKMVPALTAILSAAEAATIRQRQDNTPSIQPPFSLNLEATGQQYDGLFVAISESQNNPPYYSNFISKYPSPYFSLNGNDQFGLAYATDGFPAGPLKRAAAGGNSTARLVAVNNADGGKAFSFVTQETALDDYSSIDFGFMLGADGYVQHSTGGDWVVCGSGSYVDSFVRHGDAAANCTSVKLKAVAAKNTGSEAS